MSENLAAMAVFVRVIECGSFSKAADRLGVSKSAVSKQVARLEDRLGTRLLNRTTRQLSLTEVGARLFERAQRIVAEAEAAEAEAGSMQSHPSGTLRVAAGVSFGQEHLAALLPALLAKFPDLSIDLVLNDRFVDLVEEGYDLAVRVGDLADSALRARRLATARMVAAASPDYLARRGTPAHPRDLAQHDCLGYAYLGTGFTWRFEGEDGPIDVRFTPRMQSNNGNALLSAAAGGLGVVMMPSFILATRIRDGSMTPILQDFEAKPRGLYAVYPPGRPVAAKVRAFIDHLVDELSGEPLWDQHLALPPSRWT